MELNINEKNDIFKLRTSRVGTSVYLTGSIYTMRDAAHHRISQLIEKNENIPFSFNDKIIYYMGPSPKRPGKPIGSCGPTSSYRMDQYLEMTLKLGVVATIGKGDRDHSVTNIIKKYQSPYLTTIGGAGAYLASCVQAAETILFEELGTEAVKKIEVAHFPVIVAIDYMGQQLFSEKI